MEKNNIVVAIDGPAGAGKSTVARAVAERIGLPYLDTGALYRAIAWKLDREGIAPEDGLLPPGIYPRRPDGRWH